RSRIQPYPGRDQRDLRLSRRHRCDREVRARLRRRHRPCRSGQGHVRSVGRALRPVAAHSVLGRRRPDAEGSSGSGCRPAVSRRDRAADRGATTSGQRLSFPDAFERCLEQADRGEDRGREGVLPGRGIPPGLRPEESEQRLYSPLGCAQGRGSQGDVSIALPGQLPDGLIAASGQRPYIGRMAGHAHLEHSGDALIEEAESVLTAAGEQWTAMRADVFEALAAQDRPASAYDIAETVGKRRGKRVAANSVYRILDLFVRTNLANRVESANAYLANTHPG